MDNVVGLALVLDLVLVLLVVGNAVRGWHGGLLAGGLGLLGQVGGAALGLWAWPRVLGQLPGGFGALQQIVVLVVLVLLGAALGEAVLGTIGRRLRAHGIAMVHAVDRLLGAAGAVVVTVLVLGLLAVAVRPIVPAPWGQVLRDSRAVGAFTTVLPAPWQRAAAGLGQTLKSAGFPRVFIGPTPEPVLPAPTPDARATGSAGVKAAGASVVKVTSIGCGGVSSGSGWVSSDQRVVTNAHVVAGGTDLAVQVEGVGRPRRATLVAFDPKVDLAVLYVPGLTAAPLPTASALPDQADVVVAGFPGGGAYEVQAGRVRSTIRATGADIYDQPGATRQIYALRASLEEGDSGGPVLTTDGHVAGTVFARSVDDPQTGYALTDAQTSGLVDRSAHLVSEVPATACLHQ
ncbi:MarP family serine protease [Raineyella antarctica]|nr:MarP family serine protease [Raineyella antarctica]